MSFKNKYDHTNPLWKNLKILPLDLQIKYKIVTFMWKVSTDLILPPLSNQFSRNGYNIQKFNYPSSTFDFTTRTLNFQGVKIWNTEVPESLKAITSLKMFKKKYKDQLFSTLL